MNDPLDPRPDEPLDAELEDRLRAHFADRTAREPLPGGAAPSHPPATARTWWRRPPVLAAAAALLVVGLVGATVLRHDDEPELLDVTDSSTTTTHEPAPSSTTTVPTTTSTTVPPTSTVRSVVVAVEGVLGWWDGTAFVRWDQGAVPLAGGEEYAVVGLDGSATAVGSAPRDGCGIDPTSGPPAVDIPGLEHRGLLGLVAVAVTGVPEPTPRPVAPIGAAPYVDEAADALAGLGISAGAPEIVQALRVDLDGDGVDEVVLVVERVADPERLYGEPGDHSVVLLRQVVDGEVVTTVLSQAAITEVPPDAVPSATVTRVVAVADLNGDGVMELVTRRVVWEASATSVHVVDPGGGAELVLEVGCGV